MRNCDLLKAKSHFPVRGVEIIQLLEKNQCLVKTQLYNCPTEMKMHVRLLTLLYRPIEWNDQWGIDHGTPAEASEPLEPKSYLV